MGCGMGCVAAHQWASFRFLSSASEKVPACMPPCCKCVQSASLWGWKPHGRGSGTERTSNQKCGVSTRVSKSQHSLPLNKLPGGTLVEPVRCPQVMYRMGAQLWSEYPQGSSKPSIEASSVPTEATQAVHAEAAVHPPHTSVTVTGGDCSPQRLQSLCRDATTALNTREILHSLGALHVAAFPFPRLLIDVQSSHVALALCTVATSTRPQR